jgi:hypothetical protein
MMESLLMGGDFYKGKEGGGMKAMIPNKNLFMMCGAPEPAACRDLRGVCLSRLPGRRNWRHGCACSLTKSMSFWRTAIYPPFFPGSVRSQRLLFFEKCLFVCDENDDPVGTCFI